MRQVLAALVVALVVGVAAVPANADTRSLADTVSAVGEPRAPYDLRRVTWNYTSDRFVVTSSRMGRHKQDVGVTVRAAHDGEGYEVEARSWWEGRKKSDRLWISYNTVSRTPIDCPGLRSRWRLNFVRVSIPDECLFDGAPMRDFSAATSTSDTSEVLDEIVTAGRLTSG
jgi:hypothetical protein